MDYHIDQVNAGPLAVVACPGQSAEAALLAELLRIAAGGLHLPNACSSRQHHEIGYWGQTANIQDDNIVAARVRQELRRLYSKFSGGRAVFARVMRWCSGDKKPPIGSAKSIAGPLRGAHLE